jgi:hypothetical protein
MWYNFGQVHQTLGTTPAVAAGIAKAPWTVEEVVGLLDPKAAWRKEPPAEYRIGGFPSVPSN